MAGGIDLAVFDPGENLVLSLFPEPLELGHLSLLTGLGQRLDRIDLQLFVQSLDLLPSQARNIQQVEESGWYRCEQVVVKFKFTGREEGLDLLGEGLADTGHVPQPLFLDNGPEIFLHGLEGPGSRKIGSYLEGILPLDFHHGTNSLQHLDYVLLIHSQQLEEILNRNRRKSESRDFSYMYLSEFHSSSSSKESNEKVSYILTRNR